MNAEAGESAVNDGGLDQDFQNYRINGITLRGIRKFNVQDSKFKGKLMGE